MAQHHPTDTDTTRHVSVPTSRHVTTNDPDGLAVSIVLPDEQLPPGTTNIRYRTRLHQDGSVCTTGCGCVDDYTEIITGELVTVGDWQWFGREVALVGWRRTGPSAAEQRLHERVEELEDDLAGEKILHGLTREDHAALAETYNRRLDALRKTVRRLRAEHRRQAGRSRLVEAGIAAIGLGSIAAAIAWHPAALAATAAAVAANIVWEWT